MLEKCTVFFCFSVTHIFRNMNVKTCRREQLQLNLYVWNPLTNQIFLWKHRKKKKLLKKWNVPTTEKEVEQKIAKESETAVLNFIDLYKYLCILDVWSVLLLLRRYLMILRYLKSPFLNQIEKNKVYTIWILRHTLFLTFLFKNEPNTDVGSFSFLWCFFAFQLKSPYQMKIRRDELKMFA